MVARSKHGREKMISAAGELFRINGYRGTAFSDVVELSGSPRGSIYFHFPGGKEELALEVIAKMNGETIENVNRLAASAGSPGEILEGVARRFLDVLVASSYDAGCKITPIVVEMSTESPRLREACRVMLADWEAVLTARLRDKGIDEHRASALATMTISAVLGATQVSKAQKSSRVMDAVIEELMGMAERAVQESCLAA